MTFRSSLLVAEGGERQGRTESEAPRMPKDQRMGPVAPFLGVGAGISRSVWTHERPIDAN